MSEEQVSLRASVTWGAVAFGVALAIVVGVRLDQAALAAVVGVVCGVGASVPTCLLILMLARRRGARGERRETRSEGREARRERVSVPPVVVIAPPNTSQLPPPATWSPAQRQFAVIGEEEWEETFDSWPE